ncbi:FAD-binding and (Fe-S)-binding domain-containing protein [Agilicoccus flavus]|uniref:FAD-binding and (Fe-S)-binding domain-containing protein n=1 Tax=Agilicoccus flavus TaxID=2775968 RepID=UPI001CF66F08|nr:FAD-binding and (Fe-S)-binding domain-containing protein [Agilicoccus flavus]
MTVEVPTHAELSARALADLEAALGPDVASTRMLDRLRLSHDASHYLLLPRAVVVARDGADVAATVAVAARHGVPVTFRSGGTSLSGQAGTDGILLDTRRHFRDVEVLDDGARVRARPGATVRSVNARLRPHGRALGPDPASESACTIGGVVANNSSGMQCGTTANTYATLDALEFVLPSGTLVDTARPDADARLRAAEPRLWEGLARLRDRVRSDAAARARIEHQFSMKNTMGYGLNSLLDHDEPAQILAHLMVGSEGTLGFVASATYRTVPVRPHVATALLVFEGIDAATDALPGLLEAGARTAELMDAASLRVAQAGPVRVPALDGLSVRGHTALLVELSEDSPEELDHGVAAMARVTGGLRGLASVPEFGRDPAVRAAAWSVRKGLYTAVAGARPAGSTALLEDVVVPMPALTATVRGIGELCGRYGYDDAVIFGHARDANLHFMINPDLADPAQVRRYAAFTEDLVDLVLGADGSLKAEHGTGRIMAPYVRRQYGDDLYEVMRGIKALADPGGVLNPGVVVGDDPQAHLRHLKTSALVDPAVDRCVECGYCEPVCPSRDVTTTPRQRIALLRDLAVATSALRADLADEYDYAAVQTCAADSLCEGACPVGIDTGAFMKSHRAAAQTPVSEAVGEQLARHWGAVLPALRAGVGAARVVPDGVLPGLTDAARLLLPTDLVPRLGDDLPGPGRSRRTQARREPGDVVLFASCLGELFGPAASDGPAGPVGHDGSDERGAALAFLALCDAAGVRVRIPDGIEGLCCGTVWRSKGLRRGAAVMAERTAAALLEATDGGRIPVVTDASSCSHGLAELGADLRAAGRGDLAVRLEALTVLDAVAHVAEHVAPRLPDPPARLERVVVHPTCSDLRAGGVDALTALAARCAREVVVPPSAGCCGFAGDRGLLHPELTAGATRPEARDVRAAEQAGPVDAYVSTNRTCELGMTRATARPYRHVLEVLADTLSV